MRKLLLSFSAIVMAGYLSAQNNGIEYRWGNLIDGKTTAGDQSTDAKIDANGNVYWLGTYGSKEDLPEISYAGNFLYNGAPYYSSGTSQNNNYTLLKTDSDGNKLWVVYSNSGDFENNAGGCAVTSDGGVVSAMKVRHTDMMQDKNIVLIDANGTEEVIEWTEEPGSSRVYRLIVNKISQDGAISWTRMIDLSTKPGPAAGGNYANFWANCVNINDCTVDNNDNIYIALNFRNELTVEKSDHSTVTFTPKNIQSWNGDPQAACGDFMLLSLDSEGYYRNALVLDGTAAASYCQKLAWENGHIYAQGYIVGDGSDLKAGEFTLSPSKIMSPLVLCADADLNVNWAKCYAGEQVAGKNAIQNTCLTVCNGNLWFCGMYNLKFTDPDNAENVLASTQGNIREGFILKLDAATGDWINARDSRDDDWNKPAATAKTGLTGYLSILQNPENPEKIYAFGYVMNAAVGVFLREYDSETLVANLEDGQNNIITQGGVPSAQVIAYDAKNGCAYMTARGNKAFTLFDGTTSASPEKWGILAAKFKLPESMKTTEISTIVKDSTDAPAVYYNLQGIEVTNPQSGIYIVRRGNNVTKEIIH